MSLKTANMGNPGLNVTVPGSLALYYVPLVPGGTTSNGGLRP